MKRHAEASGKTIDEAKENALAALGLTSDEGVEFTVTEKGKKGILGIGAAPAKVIAEYTVKGEQLALEFVKTLIDNMGLELQISSNPGNNDDTVIDIRGEGAGVLIGHHGDTLDSLQYLANLAANKKEDGEKRDFVRITVDVEGYRAKREETLRTLARRMADKVLKYKKSVMLEPMNPYERRIIHSEIQNIEGVSTNSIGTENNRKIVVYLEAKAAPAAKGYRSNFAGAADNDADDDESEEVSDEAEEAEEADDNYDEDSADAGDKE